MNISRADTAIDAGGYPILHLMIDGHPAYVLEPKLTLLDAGLVVLLDTEGHWEKTLAANYQAEIEGEPVSLSGAASDSRLIEMVRRFAAGSAGNLLPA